ncbi:MAG TPA: hypothetical protein VMN39_10720 [Longimicrobiaceae bacterium]|nr:hypothetical protein [Longimicrobiaceae bacterium]
MSTANEVRRVGRLTVPPRAPTIWDEIEARMEAARRYEAFRLRWPWRWLPGRVRRLAFKLKEERHARDR